MSLSMRDGEWYIAQGNDLIPAPPEDHNDHGARMIFERALSAVKEQVSQSLGRPIEIATISRPTFFNDSSTMALLEAFKAVEPAYLRPWQTIDSSNAARLGYDLASCRGFGLGQNCDLDDIYRVILIDYNDSYLDFELLEIDLEIGTSFVKGRHRHSHLGARCSSDFIQFGGDDSTGSVARFLASYLPRQLQSNLGSKPNFDAISRAGCRAGEGKHSQSLQKAFKVFLKGHDLGDQAAEEKATAKSGQWEMVRAIVVTGDASETALAQMREQVAGSIPQDLLLHGIFKDDIDPLYVRAVGAGHRGRHQLMTPGFMDDIDEGFILPLHDEL